MELDQAKKHITELEKEVQMLSLAKIEEKWKWILDGISGCRQQILVTPVGQQFLHILREEMVAGFLKSTTFLASLAEVMVDLPDEGRRFSLRKLGLEDSNGGNDLEELLSTFAGPVATLGIDDSLPADHSWWVLTSEKASHVFTSSPWDDPQLPAWRDLQYLIIPFPAELLPFAEFKVASSFGILPPTAREYF